MEITPQCVVALTWVLKDSLGDTLDELHEPVEFLVGSEDLLPVLSAALQGHESGATLNLNLEPEDAFGDYDEELILVEDAKLFPDNIEIGMSFERVSEDGEEDMIYRITDIADGKVVVDGNHPLAGTALVFDITVKSVRPASAEEITHRHVHGEGGHHH